MELCTKEINATVKHKLFAGAFACNRIPLFLEPPFAIIINTDRDDKPGSHWIAINVSLNGHVEYFDSFGFPPLIPEIYNFLSRFDFCFCYNSVVVQHVNSIACGHFSIGFVLARLSGISFEDYLFNFETDNLKNNDKLILKWNAQFLNVSYKKYARLLMPKVFPTDIQETNHVLCPWN